MASHIHVEDALKSSFQGDKLGFNVKVEFPQEAGLQAMDKNSKTSEKETQGSVSEKRRKLLKTAATTAPVIATLQSGAAFANTSAFQCINDAKSDTPSEVVGDPVPSGDNWVRKKIMRYKFKLRGRDGRDDRYIWWYDVDGNHDGLSPVGPFYAIGRNGDIMSREFDLSLWEEFASETVNVIVFYEPNLDHTDVSEVGVYPKFYVAQPYDLNLPINASCLASMA